MAKIKFKNQPVDPDTVWAEWFSTSAFAVDKRLRRIFGVLPNDPRCKFCLAPFGIGVHFGIAYFGALGVADGLTDISAKGKAVNTAARLASKAAAGEILLSEQALQKAGIDGSALESRRLELKGISEPVMVRVMRDAE